MENNEAKKYYKVIESDVEMVGHVITLSHEKICRNGNNMGMLSIVFSAEVTDKDYDYQKIVERYQSVTYFDEKLIEQARGLIRGEFIRIKGMLKKAEEDDTALLQAESITSIWQPDYAWPERI